MSDSSGLDQAFFDSPTLDGPSPSPLDPSLVFARPGSPQFPQRHALGVFWVQSLPEEAGRLALMQLQPDGSTRTLTETGHNIRSRVHEYGGRCHLLTDDHCLFVDYADQRLYRQALTGGPAEAMTPPAERGDWMLADLCLHPAGRWVVAVGERTREHHENENAIVILDLDDAARRWRPLARGHDFYAAPRFSPDGRQVCLLSWDHPNMPWHNASLAAGAFDAESGELATPLRVAGGIGSAACQADYCKDGTLVFALDGGGDAPWQDFWNLHRLHHGSVETVTREQAEYGAAHWVFGHTRVRPIDHHRVLAVRTGEACDALVLIDNMAALTIDTDPEFVEFSQLSPVFDDEVLLMAASDRREPSVMSVSLSDGHVAIVHAGEAVMPAEHVSKARAVRIPTRDGALTHAWHYSPSAEPGTMESSVASESSSGSDTSGISTSSAPKSASVASPAPSKLMVLVHGGPTSRAGCAFDPLRQFWTTRGFTVLDVNHRGSTGYGRSYRHALDGCWGLRDVDDVIDAVQATLAEVPDADGGASHQVFIRGGSAGGYAVLTALTRYPEEFTAGACYYGIGNLVTLANSTHKFEARYLDSLLGQPWHPQLDGDETSVYHSRSPIHAIDQVKSPMILFQGSDDKVVPPAVSHEMVAALAAAGVRHRYVEYAGEGHGFRQAANRIDALESEAAFYAEVSVTA